MKPGKFKGNKFVVMLLIVICVSLFVTIFYNLLINLDRTSIYDLFTRMKIPGAAPKVPKEQIEITSQNPEALDSIELVTIDGRALSPEKMGEWPIPRKKYIPVFESFIDKNGNPIPNGIVLDIAFLSTRDTDAPYDPELAKVFKKLGNVYMQYYLSSKKSISTYGENEIEYIKKNYSLPLSVAKYKGKPIDDIAKKKLNIGWKELQPPYKEYIGSEKAFGSPSTIPQSDEIVRFIPLVYVFEEQIYFNQVFLYYLDRIGVKFSEIQIDFGRAITIPQKNIKIPIDSIGQMRINYIGNASNIFHGTSIYDLYDPKQMDPEVKEAYFKDKDIFIGIYTTGAARDVYPTPAGLMYGVEYLALAFNQLMRSSFYYELPFIYGFLIILILTLSFSIIVSKLSTVKTYIFSVLMIVAYVFVSFILFKSEILIPFTSVLLSIILTFAGILAYRILTEEKEKKFIRSTFSNFVSKVIVDELLKHPEMIKLGGERKEISVLFSDIRDFTSLSEKYQPEEIVNILNNYLSRMTATIFKYEGTLDKYVGDEIMAFWNAPLPQEDHAILSCLTALEMMNELGEFNKEMPPEYRLNIGIGINTGDAIVGNMGSTSRMDYTLIGDTVNTGARLEGTNKIYVTNIIISEFTYQKVKDYFICRLLDKIRVKGKSIPVSIYELLDVKEDFDVDSLVKKYKKVL